MNTEILRHLVALAETGSHSEAAVRTGVTQPAVSLAVKKMEGDLGVRLFERSGNSYVPTEIGRVFLDHASEVLDAEARLLSSLEQAIGATAGKLRVATSNIPGEYVLPLLLGDFRKAHPDIEPILDVMDSSKVVDSVCTGKFEIGFIGFTSLTCDLDMTQFCPDTLEVICPPSHPLAGKRSVRARQLADDMFVLREVGSATRELMSRALAEAGLDIDALKVEMELGSTSAVISAVESGAGISLVSTWAARGPLAEGRLGSITVPALKANRQFSLINQKDRQLTTPATVLKEFVLGKRAFLKKYVRSLHA